MTNRSLLSGLVLITIALAFGLQAVQYPIGSFSETGPGLFPVIISTFLLVLGIAISVRSIYMERVPVDLHFKNITLVLISIAGFALLSEYLNMIAGIVFLVFCSTFAGTTYSVPRNLKIAVGLAIVAFIFQRLFHLSIRLY